jgi:SAM-dependent methyltransferase
METSLIVWRRRRWRPEEAEWTLRLQIGDSSVVNTWAFAKLHPLARGNIAASQPDAEQFVAFAGFSEPEGPGRWTNAAEASFTLLLPDDAASGVLLKIEAQPFVAGSALPGQAVVLGINGKTLATWTLADSQFRTRAIFISRPEIGTKNELVIELGLPDCRSPKSLGINDDTRLLGLRIKRIEWETMNRKPIDENTLWQFGRPVGWEARKSFDQKLTSGFWSRFITGPKVLDIGFKGYSEVESVVTIVGGAVGVDLDYPGYDGKRLPFPDASQDAVYSSHCLEHIPGYIQAIQEWHRVTKIGGHIITVVPSAYLYERKLRPPSKWNGDHQRFYTPASLLGEFEAALAPNSYRVRFLEDNDEDYAYDHGSEQHPRGAYEITLVVEKIATPAWRVE